MVGTPWKKDWSILAEMVEKCCEVRSWYLSAKACETFSWHWRSHASARWVEVSVRAMEVMVTTLLHMLLVLIRIFICPAIVCYCFPDVDRVLEVSSEVKKKLVAGFLFLDSQKKTCEFFLEAVWNLM